MKYFPGRTLLVPMLTLCGVGANGCAPKHGADPPPEPYYMPGSLGGSEAEAHRAPARRLHQEWVACRAIEREGLLVIPLEPGGRWEFHLSTQLWRFSPYDLINNRWDPPVRVLTGLGSILYHCQNEDLCFPLIETIGTCGLTGSGAQGRTTSFTLACGGQNVGLAPALNVMSMSENSILLKSGDLRVELDAPKCAE
jgi:hypothetical protein